MRRPSLVWRLVLAVERLLPTALREAAVAGPTASTDGRRRRWVVLAAVLPSMIYPVAQIVRARASLPEVWPVWRPLLIDLAAVCAGAVLVAGAAFGISAWRGARGITHA